MKPIKILRLNRKHLSQMTYYFTSFQDNSCSHDGQSSIWEILRIENSPKPPLYFKVNPHYEDTLAFKMPYFDMDYLEKHVRPEFDEISEIIPISPEDYQKSIKYEDVCTSARN